MNKAKQKQRILFISGLFSTDRILQYFEKKGLFDELQVEIWSQNSEELKKNSKVPIKYYSLDKRYGKRSVARKIRRWYDQQFDHKHYSFYRRVTLNAQKPALQLSTIVSDKLVQWGYKYFAFNKLFKEEFDRFNPDSVVLMWPYDMSNINVAAYAGRQGVRTTAFIIGFDNISTKSRMPPLYDDVFVWSTSMKKEFLNWYPSFAEHQIKIVGAPQFDVLVDPDFQFEKETFFKTYQLDHTKRVLLFCIGSPNLLNEIETFVQLYNKGLFDSFQIILRLHPGFRYEKSVIKELQAMPNVVLQSYNGHPEKHAFQTVEQIKEWASTFKYIDVLVNSSSTVCLDAAIFRKPVINLDFELDKDGNLVKGQLTEMNQQWFHLKKMLKHTCITKTKNCDELEKALEAVGNENNCNELLNDFFDHTIGHSSKLFMNKLTSDER